MILHCTSSEGGLDRSMADTTQPTESPKAQRPRLLILDGAIEPNSKIAASLFQHFDVRFVGDVEAAQEAAAGSLVLADPSSLMPLERALADGQTGTLLSALGEGVCLCAATGDLVWANRKYQQFNPSVTKKVERTCQETARLFSEQVEVTEDASRRFAFQTEDSRFYEMIASPVVDTNRLSGDGLRILAIVWDTTKSRRLQQQLDAIDAAGSELVRIESEAVASLNTAQRLTLLEEKIINFTRELMHFDHFNIYLLEKETKRLLPVMTVGMPQSVADYDLHAETTSNGISGYVAATGRSYICHDVQNDPRYLPGLDNAASSLSVPLRLHDQVIGVFNIEALSPGAFSEDDRQIAEIFGRYIALALNILDLLVVERVTTSGTVAVNVIGEISHPLNDITAEAEALREKVLTDPVALRHVDRVLKLVNIVRRKVEDVAKGPKSILGIQEAIDNSEIDPLLLNKHVLVADDEPNIRETIQAVLTKRGCVVTICENGQQAIDLLSRAKPGDVDLIISDISMPDQNGYQVFAAARRLDEQVPVILMTGFGYDPHHSIVRASQEGLQCVLFKPFQIEQLLDEVLTAARLSSQPRKS